MTIEAKVTNHTIVKEDLDALIKGLQNANVGIEHDTEILTTVLENPKLQKLLKIQNILQKPTKHDERDEYIKLCLDVSKELKKLEEDQSCTELLDIINDPNFRCLIEAYENIIFETYNAEKVYSDVAVDAKGPPMRVVGLTKTSDEPLGISLAKHADGCIYIQRIRRGTLVERQGLFHVGDIIKEINGQPVVGDPENVYQQLQSNEDSVTVKCIPAFKDTRGKCQVFLRCHYEYSPSQDNAFPKGEVGLPFKQGDIVEVVDQSDPNWWQASRVGDSSKTGIIPSLKFEQTRKAANLIPKSKQDKVLSKFQKKGKKKIMYQTCKNSIFDCFDVRLYEEVVKMPAVESKVIALVGAQGLGRRSLITRLLNNYPDRYATVVPDTSRQPAEGELQKNGYNFLSKEVMYQDILAGRYFEWGEDKGNYYGSKLNSIRDIMNAGKIALIDCDPSALKFLRTAEFMPFIVFVEAPTLDVLQKKNQTSTTKQQTREELDQMIQESADISETYHHYFDHRLVAGETEQSYNTLRESIEKQGGASHQWVPISWVY